jgi:uncharacterized protein (TIGR00251 family)
MSKLAIQEVDEGVILVVKVVPRSSRTAICGSLDRMLKIKVAAAPAKGKANQRLLEFLAKQLAVRARAISIISGKSSPVKHIRVSGISAETAATRLNLDKQGLNQ